MIPAFFYVLFFFYLISTNTDFLVFLVSADSGGKTQPFNTPLS